MSPGKSLWSRVAAVAVALGLLAAVAAGLDRASTQTSLESMLPTDDPSLVAYRDAARDFGADPIVVLLESDAEDGSYLTPERLEKTLRLEGRLAQLDDVSSVYGPATLLNQIAGQAQDLLAELSGRRDAEIALARARAKEEGAPPSAVAAAADRARSRFDARYGPLIVAGLPGGLPTLSNSTFVEKVVFTDTGAPRGQWHFVVPGRHDAVILVRPVPGVDADRAARLVRRVEAEVERAGIDADATVSGVPTLMSGISQRAVDDAPLLGGLALLAIGATLCGAVWLRRSRRLVPLASTLLAVAGALAVAGWAGIPISLGVIAFAPVLLGIGCYYPTYLAMGAPLRTVLVVASATAASLATLTLSPLPLVRDMGIVLSTGVLLSVLLVLPFRRWLAAGCAEREPREGAASGPGLRHRVALGVAVVLAALGWVALPDLAVESDVEHFAGGLPVLRDAWHVEDKVGSSGQVGLILKGEDVLTPEALAWMRTSLDTLVVQHGDELRPVVSPPALLEFLGPRATTAQVDAGWRLLPRYLTQSVVTPDRGRALMSFGISVDDLREIEALATGFRTELPPPPEGYSIEVVGLPLVLLEGEQAVSDDRVPGNLLGVLAAGLVLLLGLRRRSDAVRAVVAAALATGIGFLLIQLTGQALNPVTVALGALTTAVGCEFTVVQAEAVRQGSSRLRSAVVIVAMTSAAGYLVLLASQLAAVRGFGLLLASTVGLALSASWLVVRATVRPPDRLPVPDPDPAKELCHA